MNHVSWVIQSNFIKKEDILEIWNAAKALDCSTHEALAILFSENFENEIDLLKIKSDGNSVVIPYGSSKLTRISELSGWRGNCYNEDTFQTHVWNQQRSDMLNNDSLEMTIKDVDYLKNEDPEKEWFIRPIYDLKTFSGVVLKSKDILDWKTKIKGGDSLNRDTPISISSLKTIYSESRFFVVDGKVVEGSYYLMGGRSLAKRSHPDDLKIAQEFANLWLPHPCCVMDLADTPEGIKVVEFNTINSSGFYQCNIPRIIEAMTQWAEQL